MGEEKRTPAAWTIVFRNGGECVSATDAEVHFLGNLVPFVTCLTLSLGVSDPKETIIGLSVLARKEGVAKKTGAIVEENSAIHIEDTPWHIEGDALKFEGLPLNCGRTTMFPHDTIDNIVVVTAVMKMPVNIKVA